MEVPENLTKLWDTLLLWSGFERGYLTNKEIAEILSIHPDTVRRRVERFEQLYPDAFQRLKMDRIEYNRINNKRKKNFNKKLGKAISFNEIIHSTYVKEKY